MTPRECLTFAIKISNLASTKYEQDTRVRRILKRLQLEKCADTVIGSPLVKGVSGGERKRTSIGYELMTNPSLLLMDEPTSGLDSDTAYRIMKLMKKEATQRGVTILATIHTPSSAIFKIFDRIIILAEGMTIFNGPTSDIPAYFSRIQY